MLELQNLNKLCNLVNSIVHSHFFLVLMILLILYKMLSLGILSEDFMEILSVLFLQLFCWSKVMSK